MKQWNLSKIFGLVLVPLTAAVITNADVKAQDTTKVKNYSLSGETMLTSSPEGRTLRLSGVYADSLKGYNIFGFMDSFGPVTSTKNTYGEIHLSKNILEPVSSQVELNSGLSGPATFRFGPKIK